MSSVKATAFQLDQRNGIIAFAESSIKSPEMSRSSSPVVYHDAQLQTESTASVGRLQASPEWATTLPPRSARRNRQTPSKPRTGRTDLQGSVSKQQQIASNLPSPTISASDFAASLNTPLRMKTPESNHSLQISPKSPMYEVTFPRAWANSGMMGLNPTAPTSPRSQSRSRPSEMRSHDRRKSGVKYPQNVFTQIPPRVPDAPVRPKPKNPRISRFAAPLQLESEQLVMEQDFFIDSSPPSAPGFQRLPTPDLPEIESQPFCDCCEAWTPPHKRPSPVSSKRELQCVFYRFIT